MNRLNKDEIKVLLINAPVFNRELVTTNVYFPMGLLYLGAVLKDNNIGVKIFDASNHCNKEPYEDVENRVLECVQKYKPAVIGIGCTFSGAFRSLKLFANKIKEKFPKTLIAIGGMHPTIFSAEILKKYDCVDFVVIGEGELTFLELVKSIINNTRLPGHIDGIAFRENGNIKLIPKTRFIDDLDSLPFIDYDMVDIGEYEIDTSRWYSPKKIKIGQPFSVISSRSCPNRCTFCSMRLVHGLKIRLRSPDNVLYEMEKLYREYGIRYFHFMDDNMTFDKQRILEICKGIHKRKMDIQFDTPNGIAINKLDTEIIDAMVGAGLVYTNFGIESGSEFIRNKIMKKGLSNKKIYEITEICERYKHLLIKGFFIIGMPEETKETLEETYEMIKNLPLDKINVSFVSPYPGTELFVYCMKHKLLPYRIEDYIDMEVFQDTDDKPHFKPHNLSMEDLISFRKKCFDYIKEKKAKSDLPSNYPLRYKWVQ